jgi:hypothetical protein
MKSTFISDGQNIVNRTLYEENTSYTFVEKEKFDSLYIYMLLNYTNVSIKIGIPYYPVGTKIRSA